MILQRIVAGFGMILAGLLFSLIFKKRKKIGFIFIFYGAITWVITVALKFIWALPINEHLYSWLYSVLRAEIAGPLFWVYIGSLTGIFECGGIYLIVRFSRLKKMSLFESYGFGYGFGCIEAFLLGLAQLAAVTAILTGKVQIPALGWLAVPAPIVERVMAIFLHLFTTLLIIYGIKEGRPSLFWFSFLYKSIVDTIAAWAQLSFGVSTVSHIWLVEGMLLIVTSVSIIGSVMFLKKK
ncbi:MAG: YhfC family intramembrane metalloprotease [Candidatus Cloacimonadota bacterium]|nr:MAG: YhfC family intramembrane metalloprotease [Candidatus Cloacimonadota bacterium]